MKKTITESHERNLSYTHLNLNLDEIDFEKLRDPLAGYYSAEHYMEILKLIREPKNFYFTLKYILGVEAPPIQLVWLEELWYHAFPMLIAARGAGKTYVLALYCLLRLLITQGCRIIITSASFRQAKFVFDYMETILQNAPVYKDLTGTIGVRKATDMYTLRVGDSLARAIPIGTGEKIRGFRANYIIAEEFSSISQQVFEEVISGFAASASSPIENMKRISQIKYLKQKGLWNDQIATEMEGSYKPNQVILSGTASWSFNHFAKYWKEYRDIIRSQGEQEKLYSVMGDKWSKDLDYKDYCIIRVPLELIPEGMMDDKNIARAKAGTTTGIADNEYHCFSGEAEIITDSGIKKIKDIIIGDKVLTHKNRFRQVIQIGKRLYAGNIYNIKSEGNNNNILVTAEHPFLQDKNWVISKELTKLTQSRLLECGGKNNLELSKYTSNILHTIVDGIQYIYPRINEGPNYKDKHYKNKMCIPANVKLDYYFGIILGYYMSEGCASANGKSIVFSLDGHVTEPLQFYIEELRTAIKNVFNKDIKIEKCNPSCAHVYICSRVIVDIFKTICPGLCHEKVVDPKILYSNPELMKGVITGYWHGDGSVSICSQGKTHIKAGCTNKPMLSQIRNCLSYFGIKTSLLDKKKKSKAIFRGIEYEARDQYILYVSWNCHNELVKLISDIHYYPINKEKEIEYKIKSKDIVNYNDYVYNLEVEEDNSYSLVNATVHNCIFSKDSSGFFPRRLIESCVCKDPILLPDGPVKFTPRMHGDGNCKYILSCDPASESDNFAIVILELHKDHKRLVYCWTTTRMKHFKRFKEKDNNENYFYGYINKKIRSLMRLFPIDYIVIDSQGGGAEVMGVLHDLRRLEPGETPMWPMVQDNPLLWPESKDYGYDDEFGLHIIEMVSMSKNAYILEANHGLKQDMENKTLLFPHIDAISMIEAQVEDENSDKVYDTMEDLNMEIMELYEELATITHTTTQNGTDRWETPPIIMPGNKRARMRKDRYSALMMANCLARRILVKSTINYSDKVSGGFIDHFKDQNVQGPLYNGPSWWCEPSKNALYGMSATASDRPKNPFKR